MSERELPSLDLLLRYADSERHAQQEAFEGLDTKAGVIIGFAGVFVVLSREITGWWQVIGLVAAAPTALLALSAFFPKRVPGLNLRELRSELASDERESKLLLYGVMTELVEKTHAVLSKKAQRLRLSVIGLVTTAAVYGLGVLATAEGGAL